ncbi:AraC family transcriptional regulator [Paenibacillus elgii]|uniref:AraC family transcriptional regulator n=1 Tax=Paenibacillus elgii TaxID=189691 RepID=A0A2T6G533_9BACL|nr:AraC family transcriptional regulator [Paenibacillus elgii]PUA39269.1 AraC family transcriptional regulator [Paenibacillus elgii]
MKDLADIAPFVRSAAPYTYNGGEHEGTRVGYTFAYHLFLDGRGDVIVDNVTYSVEKGTLIFIRPGQVHSFHHKPGFPLDSYNIYCDLWERHPIPEPRFAFYPDPPDRSMLTRQEACPELDEFPTKMSLSPHPHLIELFVQIARSEDAPFYAEAITGSLMRAFLLRWFNSIKSAAPNDYRILQIMEEMERHPERRYSFEDWCRKCRLKKSYFYKLFKQETGMTPKDYLLRMKMKKAANLLLESRQSVTSISDNLGYDSIHYFSKQFAAFYGISPTAFRSRNSLPRDLG